MLFELFTSSPFPHSPQKRISSGKIQDSNEQDSIIILYCLGSLSSNLILGGRRLALRSRCEARLRRSPVWLVELVRAAGGVRGEGRRWGWCVPSSASILSFVLWWASSRGCSKGEWLLLKPQPQGGFGLLQLKSKRLWHARGRGWGVRRSGRWQGSQAWTSAPLSNLGSLPIPGTWGRNDRTDFPSSFSQPVFWVFLKGGENSDRRWRGGVWLEELCVGTKAGGCQGERLFPAT